MPFRLNDMSHLTEIKLHNASHSTKYGCVYPIGYRITVLFNRKTCTQTGGNINISLRPTRWANTAFPALKLWNLPVWKQLQRSTHQIINQTSCQQRHLKRHLTHFGNWADREKCGVRIGQVPLRKSFQDLRDRNSLEETTSDWAKR